MSSVVSYSVSSDSTMLTVSGDRPPVAEPLPVPLTPLLGRQAEVAEVCTLMRRPDVRLVTLAGPGGVGKTRLALDVAANLAEDFASGVAFVSLAPVADAGLIETVLARAVGIKDAGPRPLRERLHEALRTQHLLLVIDSFEHLADAAPVVAELLATCPDVKVLVTSRERLRIHGEQNIAVAPLLLPDRRYRRDVEELQRIPAVALFAARARAANPNFALTPENAAAVTDICRRLDGLPLAIELAAPWIRVLSPLQLLHRLESGLMLLQDGSRDLPERQRTLRDAIAWTYDLLSRDEQALFRTIAVFSGGCTIDAAVAVHGLAGTGSDLPSTSVAAPEISALALLASLVDKHLVVCLPGGDGEPRFGMLETIRQFGLEQVDRRQETAVARVRHAEWMAELADASRAAIDTADEGAWFDLLEIEHDNIRAALNWASEQGQRLLCLRLAATLRSFWFVRGHFSEGRAWLERALAMDGETPFPPWAEAMAGASTLAYHQGDSARAQKLADQLLAAARSRAASGEMLHALFLLGLIAYDQGALAEAEQRLTEAAVLARETADAKWQALVLSVLGLVVRWTGDVNQAVSILTEADALWRARGSAWGIGVTTLGLAIVALEQSDSARAADHCHASLTVRLETRDVWGACQCLVVAGGIMQQRGESLAAVRMLGAEAALREPRGGSLSYGLRQILDHVLPVARRELGDSAFQSAWDAGRALALPEATAEAILFLAGAAPANGDVSLTRPGLDRMRTAFGLTPRELEVFRLVATGRGDRAIGEALSISHHTAMKHVANILSKMGVGSRTAAVALAHHDDLM